MCPRSIPPLQLLGEPPYNALRPMEGGKDQLRAEGGAEKEREKARIRPGLGTGERRHGV